MTNQTTTQIESAEELYRYYSRLLETATREGLPTLAARAQDEAAYWLAMWQGEQRMAKAVRKAAEQLSCDISKAQGELVKSGLRPIQSARKERWESDHYRVHLFDAIRLVVVFDKEPKGFVLYRGFGNVA